MNSKAQTISEIGVPYLNHYIPEDYLHAGKVWDMQYNENNILFLASDRGLLEFDGLVWKHYKGSKGSTRSVLVANDSTIYTGSDLDFGIWQRNSSLDFEYTSLYPFKENVKTITEEFWGVHQVDEMIVFVSLNNLYVYKNDQLIKIAAPTRFSKSFYEQGQIYVVDEEEGIFEFDGLSMTQIYKFTEFTKMQISGIKKIKDKLIIVSRDKGLLEYSQGQIKEVHSELSDLLIKNQAFSFTSLGEEYLVFGTILDGLYITNTNGKIIQRINKKRGLANNTILDLYYGSDATIWISMDLGIASIPLAQNVAYIFDHTGNFGTGQTANIHDGSFYLGTNQGLYLSDFREDNTQLNSASFSLIPASEGQVWDLSEAGDDLLCGHDKGLYRVNEKIFEIINQDIGVLEVVSIDSSKVLVGTYNGISYYEKRNNTWTFVHSLDLIKGACSQIIVTADMDIWTMIPNYGIVSAKLNDQWNIDDRTILLNESLKGEPLYLEKSGGKVYLITDESRLLLSNNDDEKQSSGSVLQIEIKHRLPLQNRPCLLNDSLLFFPVYNGFALKYSDEEDNGAVGDSLLLRSFKVFDNDHVRAHPRDEKIPYGFNNVKVCYSIPQKENAQYRHFLVGHMKEWSPWMSNPNFELLNVSPGKNTVKVEARIDQGTVVENQLILHIARPGYRSIYAYFGYLVFLLLAVAGLRRWQKNQLAKQREELLKREEVAKLQRVEEGKRKNILTQKEELEQEISNLEKELRSAKIQLVIKAKENQDKTRVMDSVKEKLRKMQGQKGISEIKMKELFRIIDSYEERENKTFQIHMDELNQVFTQKLKTSFPQLTMYDLRLCTYIKTGLSTREIAEMMHVLPSSINVSRSRLRKKLGLDARDDLFSFLEGL